VAKVLIVDDESDMRTVLYHSLRSAGHSVSEAADGEEALRKIRRSRFDLVVLDIMMPRMSGYEVLDAIRAMPSRAETPVIVVTAKHDPAGVKREVSSGANDHIAKPFLPSELASVVERTLNGNGGSRSGREKLERSAELYGIVSELRRQVNEIAPQQAREP
jgi:CheY-like chemotaxis protein